MSKYIYNSCIFVLLLLGNIQANAQSGNWTWVHGNDTSGYKGKYGVLGVAADSNLPVGRYQSAYWQDKQGNFWMFGGVTFQVNNVSIQNDLWMYNPNTNQWTWVNGPKFATDLNGEFGTKGIPSTLNYPSARGYGLNCWTDTAGLLWLYGGFGRDVNGNLNNLNDLWRYNIATNEWTWVNGNDTGGKAPNYGTQNVFADSVSPGSLQEVKSSWVDKNNCFYIFGGKSSTFLNGVETSNDMWEYNSAINKWRWRKGNIAVNANGQYGQYGVEDANNYPPARCSYTKWQDAFGNFYIFGGGRLAVTGINLNDTWRYNPVTNAWTWMNGPNTLNQPGIYGPFCAKDSIQYPHPRIENQTAQNDICQTAFWNFGGFNTSEQKCYNDLWLYNSLKQNWVRMRGADTTGAHGNYGTKGITNTNNEIPGKCGMAVWLDKQNKLWVFGGINEDQTTVKNDMWRYDPDSSCFFAKFTLPNIAPKTTNNNCIGDTAIIDNLDTNWAIQIYPNTNLFFNADSSKVFFTPTQTTTYTFVAVDRRIAECVLPDSISFTIKADTFKMPNFAVANFSICAATQKIITADTLYNYTWWPSNALLANADTSVWLTNIINNTTFTIVATYKNSCSATDTTIFSATILQPSYPIIALPNQKICAGDSIVIPIATNYNISILPVNNVSFNADTSIITIKPTVNTVYTIVATNAASVCAATTTIIFAVTLSTPDTLPIGPFTNYSICAGQRVVITGPMFYNWTIVPANNVQNSSGNVIFTPNQTTTYTITNNAQNACQISNTATLQILVEPLPVAAFTINPNVLIAPKDSITLINQSSNATSFNWYKNPNILLGTATNMPVKLPTIGQYCFTLIAVNSLGCKDTADNCIDYIADTSSGIYIPNVFSPNNDFINDKFIIQHTNITLLQMDIYNRWGQKVFATTNINQGWDGYFNGKLCDMSTYYYTITYKTNKGVQHTVNGDVLLMR